MAACGSLQRNVEVASVGGSADANAVAGETGSVLPWLVAVLYISHSALLNIQPLDAA